MATVQLFRRSQIPPSQTGQVAAPALPPLEDSGELEFIADFADTQWQNIINTRAANDKASYQTAVNLAIEKAETTIAENPGMSIEDMKKVQDNIFTEINTVGSSFDLPQSKQYAQQFKDNNEQIIKQKFQTSTAEIATQRAMVDVRANHEAFVASGNINGMEKMYTELSGNLLSAEAADAALDRGFEEIVAKQEVQIAANEKAAIEAAENNELGIARGIYDTAILEGKTAEEAELESLDYIRNSKVIAEEDKQEAQGDLNTEISYRNSIQKRAQDASTLKANNEIQAEIDNPTQEITAFIDSQPLDDIQKAAWKKAVEADSKSQLKDDIDSSPFNQGDPAVFGNWLNEAYTNPQNVDPNEMYNLSMSKAGITTAQKIQILNQKEESEKALNAGNSIMKRPEVVDALSTLTQIESDAISSIETDDTESKRLKRIEFQQIKNQFNEFVNKSFKTNPNDPDFNKKLEIEVNRLTEAPKEELVNTFFEKLFLGESTRTELLRRRKAGNIPTVTTKEERDALPKGTQYKDSKGNIAIR